MESPWAPLRSLADEWLAPGATAAALELPAWPRIKDFPLSVLEPANRTYYHRQTGCWSVSGSGSGSHGEGLCYPAPSFLDRLLDVNISRDSSNEAAAADLGLVLELGPFLGESTIALLNALDRAKLSSSRLVAIDTWHGTSGYTGMWQLPRDWKPPAENTSHAFKHGYYGKGFKERVSNQTYPAMYYQFIRNMLALQHHGKYGHDRPTLAAGHTPTLTPVPDATKRLLPVALGSIDERTVGRVLRGSRPGLVYVNPPRQHAGCLLHHPEYALPANLNRYCSSALEADRTLLHAQLEVAWSLLPCGGTLAGSGFHLPTVEPVVRAFAASHHWTLDASAVKAPGSHVYEAFRPFSHEQVLCVRVRACPPDT